MLAISDGTCGYFSSTTVPRLTCANRVHPLVRFTSLQSTASLRSALNPKIQSAFLGVRGPSSRLRFSASYAPGHFSSARCLAVLDVSHVHDGLLRKKLCGFISPHCHVQGSLFRGLLPRPQPMMFSHHLCLLVVPSYSATSSCPLAPLRKTAPSRLCSASESGAP